MTWWAVEVRPEAADREAVAEWMVRHTGQAVEEHDDGRLTGYTLTAAGGQQLGRDLVGAFGTVSVGDAVSVESIDWRTAWREGLGPRTIGRLTILPTWCEAPPDPGVLVRIDPETAFGTGEHGSTRGALTLLERHLTTGAAVIDLGAGSGILAIAAVALGASRAVGIENDVEAVPVAAANAARNGVDGTVTFLEGDAGTLAPLVAPADLILSNILRDANTALLPAILQSLSPEGVAIFSGMEASEAPLFQASLAEAGFEPIDEVVDSGWWSVAARAR